METSSSWLESGMHPLQVRLTDASLPLLADPHRLSQVFSNLLSNAAKYSDPGTPIEVSVQADDDGVVVEVRDHGIGLTTEQAARIFELFAQIDTSVERSRGGLGIGLTLVRQLVEMHGGTISVASDGLGHGSTFRVRLPAVVLADAGAEYDASFTPTDEVLAPAQVRCRVVVLDDNKDAADTLAMMLGLLGHDVQCLYDPQLAAALVESFDPEIVFLDIGMPGVSGYEIARTLRRLPNGESRLLVAVTGWGQPEDLRRTAEAGFDHHLVKPPELDAIRRICAAVSPRQRDGE